MDIIKIYKKLWSILDLSERISLCLFGCIVFVAALSEIVSISLIPIFLNFLIGGGELKGMNYPQYFSWLTDFGISTIFMMALVAVIINGIIRIIALRYTSTVSASIGISLAIKAFERSLVQDYAYYKSRNSSDITSIIANKLNDVLFQAILPGLQMLSALAVMFGISLLLIYMAPVLTGIAVLFFTVVYYLIYILNVKRLKYNSESISVAQLKIIAIMQESYQGIKEIIFSAGQNYMIQPFEKSSRQLRRSQADNIFISLYPKIIIESFAIMFISIIAYNAYYTSEGSQILAELALFAIASQRLLPSFQQMYASWASIKGSRDSSIDVVSFFENTRVPTVVAKSKNIITLNSVIKISDLAFAYPNSTNNIWSNLYIDIQKGDWIGVVGPSGVGKSTLIDVISGLIEPSAGTIFVDQVRLGPENYHLWRKNIGYVPQKIFVCDDSIIRNVAFAINESSIDYNLLMKCLEATDLLSLAETLPEGVYTKLGENGARMSGGQIQRLGIARSLYKAKSIIILDEATGALDVKSERRILKNIKSMFPYITLFVITHRRSTLRFCDTIISLKNNSCPVIYKIADDSEFPTLLDSQLS